MTDNNLRFLRDTLIGQSIDTQMNDARTSSLSDRAVETSSDKQERACYFILGMHRSGTSSIAGTLVKLGATAPTHLLGVTKGNETGHWESAPFVEFHDELLASAGSRWDDWRKFNEKWLETPVAAEFKRRAIDLLAQEFSNAPVFVFKDPRNCRLTAFWFQIFAELNIRPKIIIPFRSPLEVAQSHRERDNFPLRKGMLLWLRHVIEAEATTRHLPRIIIEWNDFLSDWQSSVASIEETLGTLPANTDMSGAAVEQFLRKDLKHQRVAEAELAKNALVHEWVQQTYAAVQELARTPGSNSARAILDQVRTQFDQSASLFGGILADAERRIDEADQDNRKALAEISRLQAEQAALRAELGDGSRLARLAEQQTEIEAARADLEVKSASLVGEAATSSRLTEELAKLQATLAQLQAERDAAQIQLAADLSAAQAALTAEREELATQSANATLLEQQRAELQARIGEVQAELESVQARLGAELDAATTALAVERDALAVQAVQISGLRQEQAKHDAAQLQLRAGLSATQTSLDAERDALVTQSAKASALEQERTALQGRLGELQSELASIRTSLEAEKANAAEASASASREREALVGETQRLGKDLAAATELSNAVKSERDAHKAQAREFSVGMVRLQNEKLAARAAYDAERARLQAALDEIQASTSWRLTGPLRKAVALFRRSK